MRLPSGLPSRLLTGAVVFGALGAARGLASGDVGYETAGGACTGLAIGVLWYLDLRRAARYRSSFDPAERTLTRPQPVPGAGSVTRRYGVNPFLQALFAVFTAGTSAMAVWIPQQPEVPAGTAWILWTVAIVNAGFLTWLALRYTTISPDGVRVHVNRRTQTVTWPELSEVRWYRTDFADTLLLCTRDGREIRTVGAEVHYTGMGRRRMERMLADIGRAWAESAPQA